MDTDIKCFIAKDEMLAVNKIKLIGDLHQNKFRQVLGKNQTCMQLKPDVQKYFPENIIWNFCWKPAYQNPNKTQKTSYEEVTVNYFGLPISLLLKILGFITDLSWTTEQLSI